MLFSERLKILLENDLQAIRESRKLRNELAILYREAYNKEPCIGCKQKLRGYLLKLKKLDMAKLKSKDNQKDINYQFKDGVVIQHTFGGGIHLTNANLTDKLAEELLRKNPNGIKLFKKFPSDWEKRISKPYVPTMEEVIEEVKKTDSIEKLETIKSGEKRTTVIKEIDKKIEELSVPTNPEEKAPE